jgi:hypothetical protein
MESSRAATRNVWSPGSIRFSLAVSYQQSIIVNPPTDETCGGLLYNGRTAES